MNELIEDAVDILEDTSYRWFQDYSEYNGYKKRDFSKAINNLHKLVKEKDYIGKKDINDEKIYADSSIVELEYMTDKYKGTISYNNDFCCYQIILMDTDDKVSINDFVSNIKIIDTIQENKLGLIKGVMG